MPGRTITVSDNGIGMSRQEVIDHIGTIAKSGTQEFFKRLTADTAKDAQLIGQFGVGFYSAFIVAHRVTLTTRRAGLTAEHGVSWESAGEGEYSIETIERDARGTDVTLHLRPAEDALPPGPRSARSCANIRPHHDSHRHEEGVVGRRREDERRAGGGRAGQPGVGALGLPEVGDHRSAATSSTSTSRTTSSRPWPTATPRWKAGRSTRNCSTFQGTRPSISGIASTATGSSSTSGGSSSWTMPSS
jgi:hypothetical protein